ncbi:MAG: homing endonuclease associated repeat-containing protein [Lachnospiraceae bacterium]
MSKIKKRKSEKEVRGFRPDYAAGRNFWKPGDPLTDDDLELLKRVRDARERLGYTPSKREVGNVDDLKGRFRTWKNVMEAAELPYYNNPDETKRRQKILEEKKQKEQAEHMEQETGC